MLIMNDPPRDPDAEKVRWRWTLGTLFLIGVAWAWLFGLGRLFGGYLGAANTGSLQWFFGRATPPFWVTLVMLIATGTLSAALVLKLARLLSKRRLAWGSGLVIGSAVATQLAVVATFGFLTLSSSFGGNGEQLQIVAGNATDVVQDGNVTIQFVTATQFANRTCPLHLNLTPDDTRTLCVFSDFPYERGNLTIIVLSNGQTASRVLKFVPGTTKQYLHVTIQSTKIDIGLAIPD